MYLIQFPMLSLLSVVNVVFAQELNGKNGFKNIIRVLFMLFREFNII